MHITYRPGANHDVEQCFRLVPLGFVCEPELRTRLPYLWCSWLRDGLMQLTALEDGERPPDQRLIAFGNSVFITDAFADELRAGRLPPSPPTHVAQRYLSGRSPILPLEAVRRANSGAGLNTLVLHIGWNEDALSAEEARLIKAKLVEAFGFTHGGYQIKEILQEVYSGPELHRALAAGALLRTDYAPFFDTGLLPLPPPPLRPYLIGATRTEAKEGSMMAPAFFYTRPRFFFKPWEQDLLQQALLGKSDGEIAAALSISPSTVQKRWQAVYERATFAAPDLLPGNTPHAPLPQTRGAEKRRHLLGYLRHHPEELRPVLPPRSRK